MEHGMDKPNFESLEHSGESVSICPLGEIFPLPLERE
jgi:hypothetical protein